MTRPFHPQWSPQNRPMVVRAKPANGKRPGTQLFYPAASVLDRLLHHGHVLVTAALSPSNLPSLLRDDLMRSPFLCGLRVSQNRLPITLGSFHFA